MSGSNPTAVGSVVPIWTGGTGGGGAVASVFGRVGAVVAVAGDYNSSQITNVSAVLGATVTDALNALLAASGVVSVFGRTGAVIAVAGDYTATQVTNNSGVVGATVAAALDTLNAGKVPTTRTLTAGAGMTGGGDLSADRTFDVVANADGSIVVGANDVGVGVLATDAQHGVRGGGTQHALVVPAGAAGFMSGADKTKLDGISAGAGVTSVFGRAGVVVAVVGDYNTDLITVTNSIPAGLTLTNTLLGAPAVTDLYINPGTGADGNAGTIGSPIATIVEAVRRLQLYQRIRAANRVVWHLSAGPHTWFPIPWLDANATLGIYADPAFDATVRTTTVGPSVAGGGTNANVIVTAGLTIDAHIKSWITFTTGAAVGQVRSITANSATVISPSQGFSPAPASGDTFIIFTVNCTINAPTGSIINAQFSVGSPSSGGRVNASAGSTVVSKTSGIAVVGVQFSNAQQWLFGSGALELYVCRATGVLHFGCNAVGFGMTTAAQSLLDQFLTGSLYTGAGLAIDAAFLTSSACRIAGYLTATSLLFSAIGSPRPSMRFYGGRVTDGVLIEAADLSTAGGTVVPFQLNVPAGDTRPAVEAKNGGFIRLSATLLTGSSTTQPLLRASQLGQIMFDATVTGANANAAGLTVACRYGGIIVANTNVVPLLGNTTPATDWDIEDGAPFDKAFFAAVGNRKFFLGNLIVRVDN